MVLLLIVADVLKSNLFSFFLLFPSGPQIIWRLLWCHFPLRNLLGQSLDSNRQAVRKNETETMSVALEDPVTVCSQVCSWDF